MSRDEILREFQDINIKYSCTGKLDRLKVCLDEFEEEIRTDAIVIVKPTRANAWQPYKCACGNTVMDDSNFCKICGAKLDWSR